MFIKIINFCKEGKLIKPTRAHYNDAGYDCYALEDFTLEPMSVSASEKDGNCTKTIPLGFGLELPDGYMATIRPRSSMNKRGIITQIGTIDSGYRGEWAVVMCNITGSPINFKKGEKICQFVVEPVVIATLLEPEEKLEERGAGGFGSTGK